VTGLDAVFTLVNTDKLAPAAPVGLNRPNPAVPRN
jgi:hypothetical protein